jgi:hypothetical protein
MASIHKRKTPSGETRWDVRYRGATRRQVKRTFKRKIHAQRFAVTADADVLRGEWIDPQSSRDIWRLGSEMAGDNGAPQAEDSCRLRVDSRQAPPAALLRRTSLGDRPPVRARVPV